MCAQLSVAERRSRGTEAAAQVPPQGHRGWEPATSRRSPVHVLADQEADRLSDLVPVRHTDFAMRYADQNERDHAEFVAAVKSGKLTAVEGV